MIRWFEISIVFIIGIKIKYNMQDLIVTFFIIQHCIVKNFFIPRWTEVNGTTDLNHVFNYDFFIESLSWSFDEKNVLNFLYMHTCAMWRKIKPRVGTRSQSLTSNVSSCLVYCCLCRVSHETRRLLVNSFKCLLP